MARRQRDYRAEEARRNELARSRGFSSRAAQRTVRAKAKPPEEQPYSKAGFASEREYRNARKDAKQWSKQHSHMTVSSYRPNGKHRDPQTFRAYYDAFVERKRGAKGRDALRHYLVDVEEYLTTDEYDPGY